MKASKYLGIFIFGLAQLAAVAQPRLNPDRDPNDHSILELGNSHSMLKQSVDHQLSTAFVNTSGAHLTYYGGPVIHSVIVYKVLYGAGTYQTFITTTGNSSMAGFFSTVTNSTYMDWLTEYNTSSPTQTIARGSYGGSYTITPASSRNGSTITDTQIQAELSAQMGAGHLPAPSNNTLYMVFFPKGKKITQNGSASCVAGGFCAYHGTFLRNAQNVYYGVMPDASPGTGCASGCGGSATPFNNQTSVASHEMIEAVTDAAVGLATVFGPPLAWYDVNNGEIGDICNAQQGTVTVGTVTYTVQKEWSNKKGACVVK